MLASEHSAPLFFLCTLVDDSGHIADALAIGAGVGSHREGGNKPVGRAFFDGIVGDLIVILGKHDLVILLFEEMCDSIGFTIDFESSALQFRIIFRYTLDSSFVATTIHLKINEYS